MANGSNRQYGLLRRLIEVAGVFAIALGLLAVLDFAVRVFAPQADRMIVLAGGTLGLYDPVIGHTLRPGADVREVSPEFDVEYKVNAVGLRDNSTHEHRPNAGTTRILLVGDSFTFGWGVPYDRTWPVLLEQGLHERGENVEIIKAGVPGYSTDQELEYLKRLSTSFKPDWVFLVFAANDLFDNAPIGQRSSSLPGIGNAENSKVLVPFEIDLVTLAERLLMHFDFAYLRLYMLTPRVQYFEEPANARLAKQLDVTKDLLGEAFRYCQANKLGFAVISLPQEFQVLAHQAHLKHVNVDSTDSVLSNFAKESGFQWIPGLDALEQGYESTGRDTFFRRDGHMNAYGNRLVADCLIPRVAEVVRSVPFSASHARFGISPRAAAFRLCMMVSTFGPSRHRWHLEQVGALKLAEQFQSYRRAELAVRGALVILKPDRQWGAEQIAANG